MEPTVPFTSINKCADWLQANSGKPAYDWQTMVEGLMVDYG